MKKQRKVTKTHADGSPCFEGVSQTPNRFKTCCDVFEAHTLCCVYDVRYEYWSKSKSWVIAISKLAGGGGVEIHFCPHCGKSLSS
jgi:hypothetical protein